MAVEDRPRLVSLDRSSSWLTVSKALEMSTNTDTSLEDHKSEEYDRILFIMNDFKVQLQTVSLHCTIVRLSESIQRVRSTVVAAELWMKCMKMLLELCICLRLETDH